MLKRLSKQVSQRLYPPLNVQQLLFRQQVAAQVADISFVLSPGYYMLECCALRSLKSYVTLTLNDAVVKLPLAQDKMTKRIIFCDRACTAFELGYFCDEQDLPSDVVEQPLSFLRLVPLRKSFAESRMLRRLGASRSSVMARAKKLGHELHAYLYSAYDRSFVLDAKAHADAVYLRWLDEVEPDLLAESLLALGTVKSPLLDDFIWFCAPEYRANEHAQALMHQVLLASPEALLVYADEDRIDVSEQRHSPWFKPAWNPDLFMAQDYVSAGYLCRRSWYEQNRVVFEQYGERLALTRLLPSLSMQQVQHLPRILFHCDELLLDMGKGSVPTVQQRQEVLGQGLSDCADIEAGLVAGGLRVRYRLPESLPLVSLLVPTRDGLSVLKPCVDSILQYTTYPNYEILILDNQSEQQETLDWFAQIASDPRVRVLRYDHPFNYSAINNFGAVHASGGVIGLINNDVEVISPDWLEEMVAQACRPEIGCVGAKLYYSNGQIQHGGVILGLGDVAGHAHRFLDRDDDGDHGRLKLVQNYSAVTAACLLVRREIYEQLGGLNESDLTVAYNDVDFCIRVREAGYRNLWTPYAELYHHESISRGEDDTPVKKARYDKEVTYMHKQWSQQLAADPAYNPNLSRRAEDFSIREFL